MTKRQFKILVKKFLGMNLTIRELTYSLVRNDSVILEAGAHVGWDTQVLSTLTKNRIHAFEPVSEIYEQLCDNVKDLDNVSVYKLALSDRNGVSSIFVSSGGSDGSSSLLKPKDHLTTNPEVAFLNSEEVNLITLDTWALQNKIKKIDFMWLDMQGMEFKVLQSSPILFSSTSVVFTEISTIELYEGNGLYSDFKLWMISQGFELIREDLSLGFTGDALFKRKL